MQQDWTPDEFVKSSSSPTSNADCVEVAMRAGVVGVRDSKQPFRAGPVLEFAGNVWGALIRQLRTGQF